MKFTLAFTLTVLFLASGLYGLILAVDPYNKFGYNYFNFETKAVDFARENKFNQIEHAKKNYTAFIMGSSSAHRYDTKILNQLTNLESYNYSTQSATPEDYVAMTRHILKNFTPKLILISFDFEVLNKNTKTDDMFYSSPLKDFLHEVPSEELESHLFNNTYLTLDAIRDSFKVIWVNLFGKAQHAYLEDGNHILETPPKELKIMQFSYPDYTFDTKRLEYLKTIRDLADKNGFKVVAFTSPLSYQHLKKIYADKNLKAKHQEFKQKLVDIFGMIYDFQNEGIKEFDSTQYFLDSNHPTHYFSGLILEQIFGKNHSHHPEFGKVIN